jgi:hypothetical protein
MKGGIFISYRRDDAPGYAGRLYDRLAAHFGAARVFMDVEGIEPGTDFVDAIERAVGSCEILIVIIGHDWLVKDGDGRRRLDDPTDFVRIETATALKRGIRVVPVLVEGATVPRAADLPGDLAPLVRRQAVELNHRQWDATSGELIATLERILGTEGDAPRAGAAHEAARPVSEPAGRRGVDWRYVGLGVAAAVAIVVAALVAFRPWEEDTKGAQVPVVYVTPATVQFDERPLRASGAASSINVQNVGPGTVRVSRIGVEGANAPDFSLVDDRCSGRELAPGQSCSLGIAFTAQDEGARSATLTIAHDGRSVPPVIALQGRGARPLVASISAPAAEPSAKAAPEPVAKAPSPGPATKAAPEAVAKAPPPEPSSKAPAASPSAKAPASKSPAQPEASPPAKRPAEPERKTTAKEATPSPPEGKQETEPPQLSVPNAIGKSRRDAIAEAKNAGFDVRIVEDRGEAGASAAPDTVVAQLPAAGESLKAGGRVTLHVAPAAPAVALPARLPRVGDSWQYQSKSIWRNVEPRAYLHRVTAVSEREIRESMTTEVSGAKATEAKTFATDTRYVEWRGNGYYVVEFNPFLTAFDVLQPDSSWKNLPTPSSDPFYSGWYTQGRVIGWETISVPAGSFKAVRVEINSSRKATASIAMQGAEPVRVVHVAWYAPDAKRTVKHVRTVIAASGRKLDEDTFELVRYTLR